MACKYGTHRVITPEGVLPQAALRINNDMAITSNELLINVASLNIDSASFTQIRKEAEDDESAIKAKILEIVHTRGKMQNPITGSGGMLIGEIAAIGVDFPDVALHGAKVGDKIATLVSLSLTPLKIDAITALHMDIDRVDVKAQAILFETGIFAVLPEDMSEALALAALDVAGAPAQVAKLVKKDDYVLVLGGGGKSGLLCCAQAKKNVGANGKVIAVCMFESDRENLMELCDEVIIADATKPLDVLAKSLMMSGGREYDISFNVVNVGDTEMSSILPVRDGGVVYLFSMATSFAKAALGAEGVGKDVTIIVGNGYTQGHADITLNLLRENKKVRDIFERRYV